MASIVNPGPVTTAVFELLTEQMPSGVLVGDGDAPDANLDDLLALDQPFVILYHIPLGPNYEPGYTGVGGMQWLRYQVTATAMQRDQAEEAAAAAVELIAGRIGAGGGGAFIHPLSPADHAVCGRRPAGWGAGGGGPRHQAVALVDLLVQVA